MHRDKRQQGTGVWARQEYDGGTHQGASRTVQKGRVAGCSLEEVAKVAPNNLWAQIAFWKDPEDTARYINRARAVGVETLVVTGDVGSSSKRERDLHHGLSMPPRPPVGDYFNAATRPAWLWRWLNGRKMTYGNYQINGRPLRMDEMNNWMASNKNPGATWEDFARLRSEWKGNLVIKGIMDAEDAARAVDEGADGIFVSNHGGRQFDSQPATIDVLPSIVDAVGGRAEIYLDGGIRRGHDIVKAVALGAKAALAGRPFAYALASGGEPAVDRVFNISFRLPSGMTTPGTSRGGWTESTSPPDRKLKHDDDC